jgi:K+-transporting ATPase KdpF subunit
MRGWCHRTQSGISLVARPGEPLRNRKVSPWRAKDPLRGVLRPICPVTTGCMRRKRTTSGRDQHDSAGALVPGLSQVLDGIGSSHRNPHDEPDSRLVRRVAGPRRSQRAGSAALGRALQRSRGRDVLQLRVWLDGAGAFFRLRSRPLVAGILRRRGVALLLGRGVGRSVSIQASCGGWPTPGCETRSHLASAAFRHEGFRDLLARRSDGSLDDCRGRSKHGRDVVVRQGTGAGVNGEDVVGLIVAVSMLAYLVYALVRPERF